MVQPSLWMVVATSSETRKESKKNLRKNQSSNSGVPIVDALEILGMKITALIQAWTKSYWLELCPKCASVMRGGV